MYKLVSLSNANNFQDQINSYAEHGYRVIQFFGYMSGAFICLMTNDPDHPQLTQTT